MSQKFHQEVREALKIENTVKSGNRPDWFTPSPLHFFLEMKNLSGFQISIQDLFRVKLDEKCRK